MLELQDSLLCFMKDGGPYKTICKRTIIIVAEIVSIQRTTIQCLTFAHFVFDFW